jgi:hypothetical protein
VRQRSKGPPRLSLNSTLHAHEASYTRNPHCYCYCVTFDIRIQMRPWLWGIHLSLFLVCMNSKHPATDVTCHFWPTFKFQGRVMARPGSVPRAANTRKPALPRSRNKKLTENKWAAGHGQKLTKGKRGSLDSRAHHEAQSQICKGLR